MPKKTDSASQKGFRNLGNTCYINTAIQTLLSYPDLLENVQDRLQTLLNEPEARLGVLRSTVLCQLLLLLLKKQEGNLIAEVDMDAAWVLFISLYPKAHEQEDANEVLAKLLDYLRIPAPINEVQQVFSAEATLLGETYPARVSPKTTTPVHCLKWENGRSLEDVLKREVTEDIPEALPDIASGKERSRLIAAKEYIPTKKTTGFVSSSGEAPVAFTVLPDHSVARASGQRQVFSPTECHYDIPAEVELTIGQNKATYVLASFGQKRGEVKRGHYVAYRREKDQWYELNDNVCTRIGTQALGVLRVPMGVAAALASESDHCARQLVYVRKDKFEAQYQDRPSAAPVIDPDVKEFPEKIAAATAASIETHAAQLEKQRNDAAALQAALVQSKLDSESTKKDGDIFPGHLAEIVQKSRRTIELPPGDSAGMLGFNLGNEQNWEILLTVLKGLPEIFAVKIRCLDAYDDGTVQKFSDFISRGLEARRGQVLLEITLPQTEPLPAAVTNRQPTPADARPSKRVVAGLREDNGPKMAWNALLVLGVVVGIVVAAAASMGIGLGVLGAVFLAIGIKKGVEAYRRNQFLKSDTWKMAQGRALRNYAKPFLSKHTAPPPGPATAPVGVVPDPASVAQPPLIAGSQPVTGAGASIPGAVQVLPHPGVFPSLNPPPP